MRSSVSPFSELIPSSPSPVTPRHGEGDYWLQGAGKCAGHEELAMVRVCSRRYFYRHVGQVRTESSTYRYLSLSFLGVSQLKILASQYPSIYLFGVLLRSLAGSLHPLHQDPWHGGIPGGLVWPCVIPKHRAFLSSSHWPLR